MKRTPSKVALLVSTAGLGLSWSGVVLASTGTGVAPELAPTIDAVPDEAKACDPGSLDGSAACLPADGGLPLTLVATAAALPLPLPAPPAVSVESSAESAADGAVVLAEVPEPADAETLDRVFASLADVLGSQLEEPAVAASMAAPVAMLDPPAVSAAPAALVAGDADASLRRAAEADQIVVVSHSDKVLMDLDALWSAAEATLDVHAKTPVVRHADKVLQTLALFQADDADSNEPALTFEPALDIDLDALHQSAPVAHEPVVQSDHRAPERRSVFGSHAVALGSDRLDEVRGGFTAEGGLKISFGIERMVYLNGALVTTTSLNIADLSKIAGGTAQVSGDAAGVLALVQSGSRNVFLPGAISATAAGTVIQNTLDHLKINTITRIDAVVHSSSIVRSINLESSMRSALIDSLRR